MEIIITKNKMFNFQRFIQDNSYKSSVSNFFFPQRKAFYMTILNKKKKLYLTFSGKTVRLACWIKYSWCYFILKLDTSSSIKHHSASTKSSPQNICRIIRQPHSFWRALFYLSAQKRCQQTIKHVERNENKKLKTLL